MFDCLISFGSNLGDSERIVTDALEVLRTRLQQEFSEKFEMEISDFFRTRPIGGPADQAPFINGVARFSSHLDPPAILRILLDIEKEFGRERRTRWDSRTLDLDLLLFSDRVIDTDLCRIPHPRMSFRRFVLEPACQVAAEMLHPICGVPLQNLLDCVNERQREVLLITSAERISALESTSKWEDLHANVDTVDFDTLNSDTSNDLFKGGSEYKLLVVDLAGETSKQFLRQERQMISRHGGPLHLLLDEPFDQLEVELSAAIETMRAIG